MQLGIFGGGQLGRMLALAGVPLGVRALCVEPTPDPPVAACAEVLTADFADHDALEVLAGRCPVVTVELEGVPVTALHWLEARGVHVRPCPAAVAVAQDRLAEKRAFERLGIEVAPFEAGLPSEIGLPCLVKARWGGFDGRGQLLAAHPGDLAGWRAEEVITEALVPFDRELSIVAARSADGTFRAYPVVENHHEGGILRRTIAPAPGLTPALQAAAEAIARRVADDLGYVGVLAVELFQVGDRLLANELAPRVHNSGHWTIEGAVTSQFEQHLRAVLGWPLGDPAPRGVSAMVNLIGHLPDEAAVLAVPGAHLHLYGKAPRPGRKIGHVTVVADDHRELADLLARLPV